MFSLTPIGYFHGGAKRKYEAPRQGVFAEGCGSIVLDAGHNFEMALRDLDGFERIWVLFIFDRNISTWRPTAHPPITAPNKSRVGVFASRAPYRPNPIGLSCVRLQAIHGRTLDIAETDLLDNTPIIDIKPYIPSADAFPNARSGWVEAQVNWHVSTEPVFDAAAAFILSQGGPDLRATACLQLTGDPFDTARKRVIPLDETHGIFQVRMFRLDFTVDPPTKHVIMHRIRSGYTATELAAPDDPYEDKTIHRAFVEWMK